jgi:hypothetical protein
VLRLLAIANFHSSPILVTRIMDLIRSSETSVLTRATRRNVTEDGSLRSHRRENLRYSVNMRVACSGFTALGAAPSSEPAMSRLSEQLQASVPCHYGYNNLAKAGWWREGMPVIGRSLDAFPTSRSARERHAEPSGEWMGGQVSKHRVHNPTGCSSRPVH